MVRLLALLILASACDLPPIEEDAGVRARREASEAEHAATPENWARCQRVCGANAALLPYGEFGRVQCSCLPTGTAVSGVR